MQVDKMDQVQLVAQLKELFAQIDVNGDGSLEWAEFTEFCVEAGTVASSMKKSNLPFEVSYLLFVVSP